MSDVHSNSQSSRPAIRLPILASTSPSLAELMRACMLRAGLSRAKDAGDFVLGNPKAWLGSAYHAALAAISGGSAEHIDTLWAAAIDRESERAKGHPLDRRFGPPATWPGYYVALATFRIRAKAIQDRLQTNSRQETSAHRGGTSHRETKFSAFAGRLVGIPDLVAQPKIVDYKTGSIVEVAGDGSPRLRQAYVRQLRIYSFLVHESLGWWASTAEVVPLHGPPVSVDVTPAECSREATEAVSLLDTYNDRISRGRLNDLASPSPESCKWCPFKLLCDPFWEHASSTWNDELDGEAIQGTLLNIPQPLVSGLAFAFPFASVKGTVSGQVSVAPINATEDALKAAQPATDFRFVSLRRRADSTLSPTIRTQWAHTLTVPVIVAEQGESAETKLGDS